MSEEAEVEKRIQDAIANPMNMGEMSDADSVGTVGSPECGDMLRMWLKFSEKDGEKVIDKASFQSFGCQTAIAVASMATEMLKGKTIEEARNLQSEELSEPLGPLPPMKIHCGQMVEGALKEALEGDKEEGANLESAADRPSTGGARSNSTLLDTAPRSGGQSGKLKVVPLDE